MEKKVLDIIYGAIDEINDELEEGKIEKKENAILFGSESVLDSIGLVNLITIIEQKIEDETGKFISIADERAMSLTASPFKTVETLKEYLTVLFNES